MKVLLSVCLGVSERDSRAVEDCHFPRLDGLLLRSTAMALTAFQCRLRFTVVCVSVKQTATAVRNRSRTLGVVWDAWMLRVVVIISGHPLLPRSERQIWFFLRGGERSRGAIVVLLAVVVLEQVPGDLEKGGSWLCFRVVAVSVSSGALGGWPLCFCCCHYGRCRCCRRLHLGCRFPFRCGCS